MSDASQLGLLDAATALYGCSAADTTALGAFESDVYALTVAGEPAVLKVMAPTHRSPEQVQAEVDWLLALAEARVPVAAPLPSARGRYVETLPGPGGPTVVVAYRRAPGRLAGPADWTAERTEAWGALLGRLQAHSRDWTAPGPRRPTLLQQTYLTRAAGAAADDEFLEAAGALLERAQPWLDERGDAGLIHADLHHGNLLLHAESWTAIDFDDCAYGSYAFDLAMPLYYAVRSQRGRPAESVAAEFLPPFLRGFRRHAPLPGGGSEAISTCLEARQAELYLVLKLKLPADEWTAQTTELAADLRARVVAGTPVLGVDWLAGWLDS